jgi:hypothetical protein
VVTVQGDRGIARHEVDIVEHRDSQHGSAHGDCMQQGRRRPKGVHLLTVDAVGRLRPGVSGRATLLPLSVTTRALVTTESQQLPEARRPSTVNL